MPQQNDIDKEQKDTLLLAYQNDTLKKGEWHMEQKMYYTAQEIAQMLGISQGKAYKILREMNAQLKNKGYLTIPGKIPTEYFREKWYGAERKEAVSV